MKRKAAYAPKPDALEAALGPQFVDFVRDMSDWLATLGRVEDLDSKIEVIGVKQRLSQMSDNSFSRNGGGTPLSPGAHWPVTSRSQ